LIFKQSRKSLEERLFKNKKARNMQAFFISNRKVII